MNIETALEVVRMNIEAEIDGVDGIKSTTLMGSPGIGKTAMMKQLADKMEMNFYHVSAPEVSIEQLSGLPEFQDIDDSFKKYSVSGILKPKATAWSAPEIIATANRMAIDENKKGCILLLDDIHETPLSTMSYFYQLLNEKKVSGWALDERVYIVAASNDSESANFAGLPSPIINRMALIKTTFDPDKFLKGYGVRYHYAIRSFLKANLGFLNEKERIDHAFGTPRSWTQFNNNFKYYFEKNKKFAIENSKDLAKASVSDQAALGFAKHLTYLEELNLNKIVKEKKIVNVKDFTDPLKKILLGYIVNFIDTIEDGEFLGKLMDANLDNKAFVGFMAGEVYLKYLQNLKEGLPLTQGLTLFLEKGLLVEDLKNPNYGDLTPEEEKIVANFKLEDENKFFATVAPYIQA